MGGHRPSIGSAKQVNVNDTTDVSNTKLKLLFLVGAFCIEIAKWKIARLRTCQTPNGRGSAVGANASEIFSTFGSRLVFAGFRWGNLCAPVPSQDFLSERKSLKRGCRVLPWIKAKL
jgi:hypothetical protein